MKNDIRNVDVAAGFDEAVLDKGSAHIFFASFCAPLTSVIYAWNSRHSKSKRVNQRQMIFIGQNGGHTGHIMIIHERQQVFSLI